MDSKKEQELFAKFLETRRVLIADANSGSRSSLFGVMKELGSKTSQLELATSYEQAYQIISEKKPNVVIAEYEMGKHCGLELLQNQREQRPKETKECIFIIVTGNTSQSAAARALEEDIDGYIIKPYTLEFVRKTILNAAINKLEPPAYIREIEMGKEFFEKGDLDKAEECFNKATTLETAPSLAYYYLGQVKVVREILHQAQSSYMKGLKFNTIHYKCLVGMYELMMKDGRHRDAYDIVKKIAKYFPANPKRLADVLRLAVINKEYEDIEKYYNMFTSLPQRSPELIRHTSVAMVICGKYYLISGKGAGKAVDIFKKAAVASVNEVRILGEIIQILLEYALIDEAQFFLDRFPPNQQKSREYLLCQLYILNAKGSLSQILDFGRTLISQQINDVKLYEIMLKRSVEAGMKFAVDDLLSHAIAAFPAKKEQYESIVGHKKNEESPAAPEVSRK